MANSFLTELSSALTPFSFLLYYFILFLVAVGVIDFPNLFLTLDTEFSESRTLAFRFVCLPSLAWYLGDGREKLLKAKRAQSLAFLGSSRGKMEAFQSPPLQQFGD